MPTTVHVNDQQGIVFFLEPNMKLGIPCLDEDNDKLFKILNQMNLDLHEKAYTHEEFKALVLKLINFAVAHFKLEEKFFEDLTSQAARFHRYDHQELIWDLQDFYYDEHPRMFALLEFINFWLNYHMIRQDREIVDEYRSYRLSNKIQITA